MKNMTSMWAFLTVMLLCIGNQPCSATDASLRYFSDIIHESKQLFKKTHLTLNEANAADDPWNSPPSAICQLCVYYERLLAHTDSLMEIPSYTLLPNQGSWVVPILNDLKRIHCVTRHLIAHLRADQNQSEETPQHTACMNSDWEGRNSADDNEKVRNKLLLLEASIEVLQFHISLTLEELMEGITSPS